MNTPQIESWEPTLGVMLQPVDHAALIERKTVLVRVQIQSLGFRRKIAREDPNISVGEADRQWISHSKSILQGPEVQALHLQEGQIREYLTARSFQAHLEAGCYLVPLTLLTKVDAQLKLYQVKRQTLVGNLVDQYKVRIGESRTALGVHWRASDYPEPESLEQAFGMRWWYRSALEVNGNLEQVSGALLEEQLAQKLSQAIQLSEKAEAALIEQMYELSKHLADALGRYDNGEPRSFRATAVEKMRTYLEYVRDMNVWDNAGIEGLAVQVEGLLEGVTVKELRAPGVLREEVRQNMGAIAEQLNTLLEAHPVRRFRPL